jgi:adenylosuccinate synthase
MPGWTTPTRSATTFDALPPEAQRYIARLEQTSGVSCAIISTGSDRAETIVRRGSVVEQWLGTEAAAPFS